MARLAERIAKRRAAGGRPRFEGELREEVTSLARRLRGEGWSVRRVAQSLGLNPQTLSSWLRGNGRRLRRVSVVPDAVSSEARFCLSDRSGWRVDGLTLEDVATLVRSTK